LLLLLLLLWRHCFSWALLLLLLFSFLLLLLLLLNPVYVTRGYANESSAQLDSFYRQCLCWAVPAPVRSPLLQPTLIRSWYAQSGKQLLVPCWNAHCLLLLPPTTAAAAAAFSMQELRYTCQVSKLQLLHIAAGPRNR
jgi:hypothetical protein